MAFDVIDAFLDRERVAPDELEAALATPGGRRYLVDIVALREVASEHSPAPAWGSPAAPARHRRGRHRLLAAAAIVAALGAGYVTGRQARADDLSENARVEAAQRTAAPVPTSIIRLEPGVDWSEHLVSN